MSPQDYDPADRPDGVAPIGLGRAGFARKLTDALVEQGAALSRGVVVGLTGEWGAGKSTILREVGAELEQRQTIVVRFDPWLISGRDDLIAAFFDELTSALSETSAAVDDEGFREKAQRAVGLIAKYGAAFLKRGAAIGANMIAPGAGAAVEEAASAVLENAADAAVREEPTLQKRRDALRDALAGLDRPIAVLIDELDRVEDGEVRAVAQLVKAVADFPAISYLIAYDRTRVIEALAGDKPVERGAAYLEKIVQYEVAIPVAFDDELRELAVSGLEELATRRTVALPGRWIEHPLTRELFDIAFAGGVAATPRDVKRWIGQFDVLEPMARGEVHWADLLGFALLESKHSDLAEAIRENATAFIGERTAVDAGDASPEWFRQVTGLVVPPPALRLIGWLFEAWREIADAERWSGADRSHPERIRFREPFYALARRGLPPWAASRDLVSQIWREGLWTHAPTAPPGEPPEIYWRAAPRLYRSWVHDAAQDEAEALARWDQAVAMLAGIDPGPFAAIDLFQDLVSGFEGGLIGVARAQIRRAPRMAVEIARRAAALKGGLADDFALKLLGVLSAETGGSSGADEDPDHAEIEAIRAQLVPDDVMEMRMRGEVLCDLALVIQGGTDEDPARLLRELVNELSEKTWARFLYLLVKSADRDPSLGARSGATKIMELYADAVRVALDDSLRIGAVLEPEDARRFSYAVGFATSWRKARGVQPARSVKD